MSAIERRTNVPANRLETSRQSSVSDTSDSSGDERDYYDDEEESLLRLGNDSQSSLDVSLEDMDIDSEDFEERCRVSPISRLPAELLIAVFSRLSSTADIKSCMLVSNAWARCSVDLLWHRPSTGNWKNLINVIQTARKPNGFFAYHELVRRLNLAQLKDQISDGTLQPLSNCKRIERLTLTDCVKLTDLSVAVLVEGNRNLLAIDLSGLDAITDKTMFAIAENCYKLQGLNITKCIRVTDESLEAIARNCRRVKRLKFNECPQITDRSVLAFADNCHDILEIDLQKCMNLTDISVTSLIAGGRQLRELRLSQCERLTDESFLQLPLDHIYENLRVLDLTNCHLLSDAGLSKIVNSTPKLRNLVLAKCTNITDRGVAAITKLGKNLHYIHLGHCARITDYGVSQLVRLCSRIRYIDLACCTNLTDDSVSLLASLPKLKRIGLVKCAAITDLSLKALARPKPSAGNGGPWPNMLERLHLSYCSQLTVVGIRTMLLNCPRLTHLSLTGVVDFLREDLVQFCRSPPEEFNPHQRDVFCVFSGRGVFELRKYLQDNYVGSGSEDMDNDEESNNFDAVSSQLFQQNIQPHQYLAALQAQGIAVPMHPQTMQHMANHFQATLQGGQNQGVTHIANVQQYQQQLHQLQLLQHQMQQLQAQQSQQGQQTQQAHPAGQHHQQTLPSLQQAVLQYIQPQQPQQPPQAPQAPQAPVLPSNAFNFAANAAQASSAINTPFATPGAGDFATAHLHAHPFTPRPLSANPTHPQSMTPVMPGTPVMQQQQFQTFGLGIQGNLPPPPPPLALNAHPLGTGPGDNAIMIDDDDDDEDEDLNDGDDSTVRGHHD